VAITVAFDDTRIELPEGATVADLLRVVDLSAPIFSVICNGQIVRRSDYGDHPLEDGDELTAVVQVGGG